MAAELDYREDPIPNQPSLTLFLTISLTMEGDPSVALKFMNLC